jgi:hypothetical protein
MGFTSPGLSFRSQIDGPTERPPHSPESVANRKTVCSAMEPDQVDTIGACTHPVNDSRTQRRTIGV